MHRRKSNAQLTWTVLLVFLLFALRANGGGTRGLRQRNVKPRIVNGQPAPAGRFPYMCSIQQRTTETHICGAVLIGCRWVLTAAHCFQSNQPGRTVSGTPLVRCGIHQREDRNSSKTFSVERVFLHEDWNGTVEDGNDIALLKLTKRAELRTPDLDAVFSDPNDGVLFAAPGFGVQDLPFVRLRACNKDTAWNNSIKSSMICAGHGSVGTCQGDSGGPLLTLNRKGAAWEDGDPSLDLVVGIVSYGEGVCDEDLPGIYTRVSSFHSWILEKIGDDDGCSVSPTSPESPSPKPKEVELATAPDSSTAGDSYSSIESEIFVPFYDDESSIEAAESAMSPQGGPGDGFPDYCGLDVVLFVLCLSHPFCPDYPDPPQTRMEEALEVDDTEAIQELLCCSLGANTTLGPMEYPLLTIAIRSNAIEATKTLLDNGADRDGVDNEGLTGLSHAVITNSILALETLIACAPDVEKADDQDRTPLHYAALYGNVAAVKILLDHEASTSRVDYNGDTPFDLICNEADNCSEKKIENLQELLR